MTPSLDRATRHRPAACQLSAVIDQVIVVLPAHDERSRIGDAVASIHRARAMIDARVRSMLVVVADTCSDDTAALSRKLCGAGDLVLETTDRSVGTARRKGTHAGPKRTDVKASNVWLANTGADSVVPDDWLTGHHHVHETGEDYDLWRRLSCGGPLVSSTAIRVATSPRSVGRAPAGFAVGLTELVNRVGVA